MTSTVVETTKRNYLHPWISNGSAIASNGLQNPWISNGSATALLHIWKKDSNIEHF